jgi:2-oxoglutarate ferredoxin oxidoreductase subunit beta
VPSNERRLGTTLGVLEKESSTMAVTERPLTLNDYKEDEHNTWCPQCGDFAILNCIQRALAQLQIPPHMVAMYSGIGCSGKLPHYVNAFGFHTLHGRVMPNATGAKLANRNLTVMAVGGDGDGFGIGCGYFINAGRRNVDMTYIVFNNGVYGLTKGQGAPTLQRGMKTKSMPEPAIQDNLNPIALAIGSGYTFAARAYSLDIKAATDIISQAIEHKGTSFIDMVQTCPTYNDLMTKTWLEEKVEDRPRLYQLAGEGYDGVVHDPSNVHEVIAKKAQAVERSYEWGDRIPLGVFYQARLRTYEEELEERLPEYATTPLVEWETGERSVDALMDTFR